MQPLPYFTIVDRYFIRQLLWTTFLCFFCVVGIYLLFDMLPKFESIPELFREHSWGAFSILFQYYTVRILNLLQYTGITFIILGVTITFYSMERNSNLTTRGGEVIPMLTSGFSRWRVAIPFCYTGIFMVLLLTLVLEGFFPYCESWPGANSSSYTPDKTAEMEEKRDFQTGITILGNQLDLETGTIQNPRFIIPISLTHSHVDTLIAATATWMEATSEHPSGYALTNVVDLGRKTWIFSSLSSEKIILSRNQAPWMETGELFICTEMRPTYLRSKAKAFVPESLWKLRQKLAEPNDDFQLETRVALHSRILKPFLEMSLFFLTIPIILSARLRSKLMISILLLGVILLFQLIPILCRGLGERDVVSPFFAAWIPIFVFYSLAAILFDEFYT
ncbi:MAG: LptF/LptG family permease [Planctomycetia bacterium]|nr:LptF/LptG family permease [Planctomycetia bacterium]